MVHFLLATYAAQGHINPSLQFAKHLVRAGAEVTFSITVYAHRRMLSNSTPLPQGITFFPFSDDHDDGFNPPDDDLKNSLAMARRHSTENLTKIVLHLAEVGRPVTCLVHTLLLSWAAQVALNLNIPSTLLWIQPASVFDIYYYYFNGYGDLISGNNDDPSHLIRLPGLPPLTSSDIPSFLFPSSNPFPLVLGMFQEQFEVLERMREKETPLRVLVNTFDAFEHEALTTLHKFKLIGIGPLIPSAFLDFKDSSDTSFGGDLINGSKDTGSKDSYIEWLNSKDESSVVYISFGSMVVLAKTQLEEISCALVESGRPFLWVIRTGGNEDDKEKEEMVLELKRKHKERGLIVPWCSQVEVLNHPSVGCFVSHCGWNSILESLVAGVPVVAFPQWSDQGTNAKLIEDVCRTGVRVKVNTQDKLLESEELNRCLEIVMGEQGKQVRMNTKKWKDIARKAAQDGGSSDRNLRSFVEEVERDSYQGTVL